MSNAAQDVATYADLVDLPDNLVGELLMGTLYTQARPAPKHARASSTLGVDVGSLFDRGRGGPGGWWILDERVARIEAAGRNPGAASHLCTVPPDSALLLPGYNQFQYPCHEFIP